MRVALRNIALIALLCFSFGELNQVSVAQETPAENQKPEVKPYSTDPRLELTLVAEHPKLVTPTGLSVDAAGRVWVIESHTHFPPEDYQGHSSDRILVFSPDADGKLQAEPVVFADGFKHTMSILVAELGKLYIATRKEVFLLTDANNDLKLEDKKVILSLESKGDYPHNGLAGFAINAQKQLFIGLGENVGADYKLTGTDGSSHSGGGEGGSIFRCELDGSKLTHWSTGFWNPHASCINAKGELFTVDNDPDSRPPCRLMHVTPQSDFGYRYRNGRRGTHPFTSWNGELPGTMPMLAGTGEAPSGIVSYDSHVFPPQYYGSLLVGSWGDHRIDRFKLKRKGSTYTSQAEVIVKGGENFRPVGLAIAPEGSLYFTDWVLKEYKVHGQGRLWRLSVKDKTAIQTGLAKDKTTKAKPPSVAKLALPDLKARLEKLAATVTDKNKTEARKLLTAHREFNVFIEPAGQKLFTQFAKLNDKHLFNEAIVNAALHLSETELVKRINQAQTSSSEARAGYLVALRRKNPQAVDGLRIALHDLDPVVQQAAVQWVGEEKINSLRTELDKLGTTSNLTSAVFQSLLAAFERLDAAEWTNSMEKPGDQYVVTILSDEKRPASLRAQALRMLPPYHHAVTPELLTTFLRSTETALQREALFTLQQAPHFQAGSPFEAELIQLLENEKTETELKAEILFVLGKIAVQSTTVQEVLQKFAANNDSSLRREALRSLKGIPTLKPEFIQSVITQFDKLNPADKETEAKAESRNEIAEQFGFLFRGPKLPLFLQDAFLARPVELADWTKIALKPGDAVAGRRAFFHHIGAGCYRCHMVRGRGGNVGPDLSNIARTSVRQKLAESILEPHKEIAPQFTTFTVSTKSGKVFSGIHLGETSDGKLRLGDSNGTITMVPISEIEDQQPQKKSIMPDKLNDQLTVQEFLDLLSYLESLR